MTMTRFYSTFDDPHKSKRDDDDEFAFDHIMGRFNRHEPFRADHDPGMGIGWRSTWHGASENYEDRG